MRVRRDPTGGLSGVNDTVFECEDGADPPAAHDVSVEAQNVLRPGNITPQP